MEFRKKSIVKKFLEAAIFPLSNEIQWKGQDHLLKTLHVQHIYNRLTAVLKEGISDEKLIQALHPTPALGGYPERKSAFVA